MADAEIFLTTGSSPFVSARTRYPGNLLADCSHSHNPQGFSGKLRKRMPCIDVYASGAVLSAADVLVVMESDSCQIEDMHPCCLGNGIGGICGNVAHFHAALTAQVHIYIVNSCACLAYEFELRCRIEKFLVHDDLVEQSHVGICNPLPGLFGGRGRITHKFAECRYFRHVGVTHCGGVQEYYFHLSSVSCLRQNTEVISLP